MKSRSLKSIYVMALVFMLTLAGTAVLTPVWGVKAQKQEEQEKSEGEGTKLEGKWRVRVTIRVCKTGAEIRTFPSLVTFTKRGTMTETTSAASPALRGPGHGVWERTDGHTFSSVFEAFTFNQAGAWTGTQRVTQTIEIGYHRERFNADASNEIFDAKKKGPCSYLAAPPLSVVAWSR